MALDQYMSESPWEESVFLVGEGGSGKTCAGVYLNALSEQGELKLPKGKPVIAAFVPMPLLRNRLRDEGGIDKHLLAYFTVDAARFEAVLEAYRVLVVLDSLDEATSHEADVHGLVSRNPLLARCRVVVTSRVHQITHPAHIFAPLKWSMLTIQPFTKQDATTLCHMLVRDYNNSHPPDAARAVPTALPPFAEQFYQSPFLLCVLSNLGDDAAQRVTSTAALLDTYIQQAFRLDDEASYVLALQLMRSSWHCTLAEAKEIGGEDVAAKVPCRVEDPLDDSCDFSFIHRCLGEYLVAKYIATSPDATPLDVLRGLPCSVTIPIFHLIQRDPRSCAALQQQTAETMLENGFVNNQSIESLRLQLNDLEARFGKNSVILIDVLVHLGGCLNNSGKSEEALSLMQRALQIEIAIFGRDGFDVARTHMYVASVHFRQAEAEPARATEHLQAAKQQAERALEIHDSRKFPNDEEVAEVLVYLAKIISAQDPCKAKLHLERALRIQMKLFGPSHHEVASTMLALGEVIGRLGDSAAATKMMQSALPVLESHYGPDHSDVAVALLNASAFDDGMNFDPKERAQILRRCIKTFTEFYGPTSYQVAIAESRLARALLLLGKPLEAKELVEKALPVLERHNGQDSVEVGAVLETLGRCYCNLGNPLKKRELHYRALNIYESHYGPNHLSVGIALAELALGYGDPKQEIIFLQRALPILEKNGGPNSIPVADALTSLGDAMNALWRAVESIPIFERALTILESHFGPSDVKLVRTLSGLATANGCRGDHAKKLELLTTALSIAESFYGPDRFEIAIILNNLANAYGDCGDAKTKLEILQRSRRIEVARRGPQ